MKRVLPVLFCAALAVLPSLAQGAGGGRFLASHRAVYDIALETASSASGVTAAGGEMRYQAERHCDGWVNQNSTRLLLRYDDGGTGSLNWSYAASESLAPSVLRARVLETGDDGVESRVSVRAEVKPSGGKAVYNAPSDHEKSLPAGTLFPMSSLADLLDQARAGKLHVAQVVFDGATQDNPYKLFSAVYGAVDAGKRRALEGSFALEARRAWRIRMGYFPIASRRELPEFEVEADYREDGIATDILQDFGDFSLRLTVRELEILPEPECL